MSTKMKSADFIASLRLYFSSLTARGAKYLYINIGDLKNTFIISNGDYSLLTSYCPVMLSIHVLEFKNTDFYDKFIDFLQLPTDKPYLIRTSQFLKALKSKKIEELCVVYDNTNKMKIVDKNSGIVFDDDDTYSSELNDTHDEDDEYFGYNFSSGFDEENPFKDSDIWVEETFETANICGQIVDNQFAIGILEDIVLDMKNNMTNLKEKDIPLVTIPITNPVDYFTGNYFRLNLNFADFQYKDGTHFYTDEMLDLFLVLVDGLDLPSVKEFLKKKKDSEVLLYDWGKDGGTVQHMAKYEDDEILVYSMRPFMEFIPIKTKITYNRRYNSDGSE